MFAAYPIAIVFVAMFAAVLPVEWLEKGGHGSIVRAMLTISLISGTYCLAAGVHLLGGWQDPFAAATSQELAGASASSGRRGGLIILMIRFWPYVLIGLGGYAMYNTALGLWNRRSRD
jgi:hypothetical protein